jgi:radical SAM superfamily enzyme YgiQ (UPF0313 family)
LYWDLGGRVNYALAQAPGAIADKGRKLVKKVRAKLFSRRYPRISEIFAEANPADYDIVLVSTYLMYYPVCVEIGRLCEKAGVPLLVGGAYNAETEVAQSWLDIPGLHALVAGEVELELADMVRVAVEGGDLLQFKGVWLPDGRGGARPPLTQLDMVPFPDYSDFPWDKYPHRIVPLISGRGCGWGVCTFCSDVTSAMGRTYRSRSSENLLDEVELQSRKHDTSLFVFTDLKLNSDLSMWNAITSRLRERVDSPRWIGAVHVGSKQPNGLDLESLKRAKESGAVRLTTGIESGSQRVLDEFAKGTDLSITSQFLHNAATTGISVRATMIHGAPGETAEDVDASAEFLNSHKDIIDRVKLSRFSIMMGPVIQRRFDAKPSRYPTIIAGDRDPQMKILDHQMTNAYSLEYFLATQRLLHVVHLINRKKLPNAATAFEGVM